MFKCSRRFLATFYNFFLDRDPINRYVEDRLIMLVWIKLDLHVLKCSIFNLLHVSTFLEFKYTYSLGTTGGS